MISNLGAIGNTEQQEGLVRRDFSAQLTCTSAIRAADWERPWRSRKKGRDTVAVMGMAASLDLRSPPSCMRSFPPGARPLALEVDAAPVLLSPLQTYADLQHVCRINSTKHR